MLKGAVWKSVGRVQKKVQDFKWDLSFKKKRCMVSVPHRMFQKGVHGSTHACNNQNVMWVRRPTRRLHAGLQQINQFDYKKAKILVNTALLHSFSSRIKMRLMAPNHSDSLTQTSLMQISKTLNVPKWRKNSAMAIWGEDEDCRS